MPNLGGLRSLESISPDKANANGVIALSHTEMSALSTAVQVGLVHCTSTGSGFIKDIIYCPVYDGSWVRTAWVPVMRRHDHSVDDDIHGGSLMDIYYANGDKAALIDYFKLNTSEFRWFGTYGGGGVGFDDSQTDDTSVIIFTGNTDNNNVTLQGDGIRLLFEKKMRWDMRLHASHNSEIYVRVGVNIDRLNQTQSTTRRQIGIEGCYGSGVPGHGTYWAIITSNGTSGNLTATNTLLSISAAADLFTMLFVPSVEARLYYATISYGASGASSTPYDGSSDHDKQWRMGVQTLDATGKSLWYWGGQQIGVPHSGF